MGYILPNMTEAVVAFVDSVALRPIGRGFEARCRQFLKP